MLGLCGDCLTSLPLPPLPQAGARHVFAVEGSAGAAAAARRVLEDNGLSGVCLCVWGGGRWVLALRGGL